MIQKQSNTQHSQLSIPQRRCLGPGSHLSRKVANNPTPEDFRRPHQALGGAIMLYKQPQSSWVGSPTDWNITGSQRLTYRSESSETHIKRPRVGMWHWEQEPVDHLALKASGACAQELHQTGGNGDPILKSAHRCSWALGPRAKQSLHRNPGHT